MNRIALRVLAVSFALVLALSGCRRGAEVVAPREPVAAVQGLARALRENDLVRYAKLSVPPALYARQAERWRQELRTAEPATDEARSDYARWMGDLTAPGAEARLYARAEARLEKLKGELDSQWPLMSVMAVGFLKAAIAANETLSGDEKSHANAVVDALSAWATAERFTDRERARRAIGVLAASARELSLPTLEHARALEMEPALAKGGIALKGLKALGKVYGLDIDAALDGMTARVLSIEDDEARLEISYLLLGERLTFEMGLLRRDGGWYSADAIRDAEEELAEPLPQSSLAAATSNR